MNLKVFIIFIAAVALLAVPVLAESNTATIRGVVYSWDTFEPLENAIVEVNSTPSQSMMAKYGIYSFELEPGNYLITASYYENSTLVNSAEKSIEVKKGGSYVIDLFLLPVYSEELIDTGDAKSSGIQAVSNKSDAANNSDVNDSNPVNASTSETDKKNGVFATPSVYYFPAALLLFLLLAGGYTLQKHKNAEKNRHEDRGLKKRQPEAGKPDKGGLWEEKAEYEMEKAFTPASTAEFSAKTPEESIEQKSEPELPEPVETRYSEELKLEFEEKEKQLDRKDEEFRPEIKPTSLEQGSEDEKETSVKENEPEAEPEPSKPPEKEKPVIRKNLPLPADLQEIMDIIRGQGGRITQKDLRSKLKYSEGKVSLMLADLERRELIEKFKRGRGNVIILRDEKR